MPEEDLDRLLAVSPKIAKALNDYPPEVRQAAHEAMMAAYNGGPSRLAAIPKPSSSPEMELDTANHGQDAHGAETSPNGQSGRSTAAKNNARAAKAAKAGPRKAKQSFSLDKTLDLVNGGSPSFKEFYESKKPTSGLEKCLVSVYWLSRHTHNPVPVTLEQVYTCFKAASWAVPSNLTNMLHQAGSKGWLDTKKRDDIKVVVPGENYIEHSMPAQAKSVKIKSTNGKGA